MNYIGNIGALRKSIYVRDKLPKTQKKYTNSVKAGKNISKFTYAGTANVNTCTVEIIDEITIGDQLLNIRNKYNKEIRIHGEQVSFKEGFIYLISNSAFPGWIKAGMTIDYENRLSQYNMYDPINGYRMHTIKWVTDRRNKENLLLSNLKDNSTFHKGEWFYIEENEAIKILTAL